MTDNKELLPLDKAKRELDKAKRELEEYERLIAELWDEDLTDYQELQYLTFYKAGIKMGGRK